MSLANTIVLKFKYCGSVVLVRVSLIHGLTWMWVAKEVLRLHLLSLDTRARDTIRKVRIAGIIAPNNEKLDPDRRILYYDVKSMMGQMFFLHTEGPFAELTTRQMLHVFSYLDSATAANSLLRTCKRLHKLFASDEVWSKIAFTFCDWCGVGTTGIEDSCWEKARDDAGLTILSIYRLRWMSHHASKLKLFYGATKMEEVISLRAILGITVRTLPQSIVVVGDTDGSCTTHTTMRLLHYVVPESATRYHLSRECKPYLPEAMLLDIEPSPANSRSRNLSRDPGTLVEGSMVDTMFKYRRVGDPRLTFLGVDVCTATKYRHEMNYPLYYALTATTIGSILLLEYNEQHPTHMCEQLETLWATVQFDFGVTAPGNSTAWEACKDTRFRTCTTPVVILLYIDWMPWAPLGGEVHQYTKTPDFRIGIRHAVFQVHEMLLRLCRAHPHRRAREWYIQPVDACTATSRLDKGFFAGLNWLLRVISGK